MVSLFGILEIVYKGTFSRYSTGIPSAVKLGYRNYFVILKIMTEKLVKCPFDPSHIMTQYSLQRHVLRCKVKYPDFVTCPYHALHRFANKDLLAKHLLICDAKDKAYLFQELDDFELTSSKVNVQIPCNEKFSSEEENWDK